MCSRCYVDSSGKTRTDPRSGTVAPGEPTQSALTAARRKRWRARFGGICTPTMPSLWPITTRHLRYRHWRKATGGCVSDSLEMARFGRDHPAETLIVAGVRFMGETAKILTPDKRVLMPPSRQPARWTRVARSMNSRLSVMPILSERWWCMPTPLQRSRRAPTGW